MGPPILDLELMPFDLDRSPSPNPPRDNRVRVIGFVGSSGSGKTTLIEQVIPLLRAGGVRVGVIKHAHHGFDMDRPGKDSYRARAAGAAQVLVASRQRWVLMGEVPEPATDPDFRAMLGLFDADRVDLIIAEGFSGEAYPKIEVYRPGHEQPPRCWPHDPHIIAVASDIPQDTLPPVTWLDLNRPDQVVRYLMARLPLLDPIELAHDY
jgi:molybdopterin-guanine dinucleotide biosynthesis adapter protein